MRKNLPKLGEVIDDVKVKDKVSIQERYKLIIVDQDGRKQFIKNDLRDELKLIQPSCTPPLSVGLVLQILFFYEDNDAGCAICGWSTGTIARMGKNNNGYYFSKGVSAEVR